MRGYPLLTQYKFTLGQRPNRIRRNIKMTHAEIIAAVESMTVLELADLVKEQINL